ENRAGHLPRDSALVMIGLEKIEGARFLALRVRELNAILADKRALLELIQKAHALKRPVSVGHQRFAYMMAREFFFLEDNTRKPCAGENAGTTAAGRASPHHNNIVIIRNYFHIRYIEEALLQVQKI